MSTKEDVKLQRGTKRMCQNPECGSRFYDLNRDPITCPICNSVYQIVVAPPAAPATYATTSEEARAVRPR